MALDQSLGQPLNSTWLLATPGNQYPARVLYQALSPWAKQSAQAAVWTWWWFPAAPVPGNVMPRVVYILP